jgi:hypothetical protein
VSAAAIFSAYQLRPPDRALLRCDLVHAYLSHARHDIPFSWVFLAFGVFIIACSATHFMEVWTIWHATWLSGYVKLLTAAASVATAVVLPFLVPKVLMLIQAVKLSEERRTQ